MSKSSTNEARHREESVTTCEMCYPMVSNNKKEEDKSEGSSTFFNQFGITPSRSLL